jgi:YesN/AraC family two-component response regulator
MIVKIMVVDDSDLIITILTKVIQNNNPNIELEFIKAHDGMEAVEKYVQEKPDFVFMDIKMPKMDGITAIKKIKDLYPNAKIAVVTSLIRDDYYNLAKEAGAVEFLTKPFKNEDIQNILDKFVKLKWE